jgi:RNA polymerase sigma-70 factor (ECF subfamily)
MIDRLQSEPDERQLAEAAKANPEVFASLYDLYVLRVCRYMLQRTGNEMEAEDLASQVFLAALKSLPHYSPKIPFGAWLFTIARRRLADYYRLGPPDLSLENRPELLSSEEDPLKGVLRNEEFSLLESQLARLEEKEREVLRLRYAAELSYGEIAFLLGMKEDALKKTVYRLLDRLERRMEADNE